MENTLKEKLSFKCSACGNESSEKPEELKIFEVTAIDDIMDWSDFEYDVPHLDFASWERTSQIPTKGKIKKVLVYFPFNMSTGDIFWTFFRPALSQINGWRDYPQEINSSALIKCKFESIISKDDMKAWINIEILESIPVNEFSKVFPEKTGIKLLNDFKAFRHHYAFKHEDWILFDAGAEGNIGIWALIKKTDNKYNLLAYGDWSFHYNVVYCGNILLEETEVNELIKLCIYD